MAARVRECLIDCARRFVLWGLPNKKQDVEGGVLSAALKLGNVNTRETSEISKFLLR